jgi:hypothetical protein
MSWEKIFSTNSDFLTSQAIQILSETAPTISSFNYLTAMMTQLLSPGSSPGIGPSSDLIDANQV